MTGATAIRHCSSFLAGGMLDSRAIQGRFSTPVQQCRDSPDAGHGWEDALVACPSFPLNQVELIRLGYCWAKAQV
jgi:hypothetical protein